MPAQFDTLSPPERLAAVQEANGSYNYFGWVFDRMEEVPEQCLSLAEAAPTLSKAMGDLSRIMAKHGRHPGGSGAVSPPVPVCAQIACTLESVLQRADAPARAEAVRNDADLPQPHGNSGGAKVFRLRTGIARFLTTDANPSSTVLAETEGRIPVLFDAFASANTVAYFNHLPGGSNVLYLDGHVAFSRFPNAVGPVTKPVGQILGLTL